MWGCALLAGFFLAAPPTARAQAEQKADAHGLDRSLDRIKKAVDEAEEKGKIEPRVAQALDKLIQTLEEEEQHPHHRHHSDEGTFASGYEPFGEPSIASTGSAGGSDPSGDFSGGSSDSGSGSDLGSGPMGGSAGSGLNATPATGNNSSNKQSQEQQDHHHRHNHFAEGLRHAEREWREWRREERLEHRLEHAFARGLRAAEEHAEAKAAHAGKGSTGSNTANAKLSGPGHSVGTKLTAAERHEHPWNSEDPKTEGTRKTGASSRPGGLTGQHPKPAHAPTGGPNHASPGAHAGTLVGTRHSNHKK
jgi:hypothetical protein